MDSRVTLCAPPAPMTQRAWIVSGVPSDRLMSTSTLSSRSRKRLRLDAAVDGAAKLGQSAREDLLGPPLRQAALESPRAPGPGARPGEPGLGRGLQLGVEQPCVMHVDRGSQDLVDEAGLGEDLECSWLERGRSRLPRRRWLALDHARQHAVPGQLDGREQAGRAGADDEHVSIRRRHPPSRAAYLQSGDSPARQFREVHRLSGLAGGTQVQAYGR